MATIEFYWDAVSPYTYLAATRIERFAAEHGAALVWKPVLLGKLFEACGNRAPLTVPAKGQYMFADLQRWARHYGVPLQVPSPFPVSTLNAQRIASALGGEDRARWARASLDAYWTRNLDISQPPVLAALAAELGFDGPDLLARAQTPEAKEQLKAYTDEAVQRGAFGAPTFFIGDAMFWGNDRFELMASALADAA
ncbi:2-hydroxychromene-2-carboxylate isomerase [Solimonas variicoloris]|uniref:2-hydroxychromene-2-carboxylate isomerase n=1 Tax=Solimonas variicoloris TaxID=254408 RepID=UPI00036D9F04|nr:2-hydroxychromene-2-carboxylate isomerase [Solimonas variicoloris]